MPKLLLFFFIPLRRNKIRMPEKKRIKDDEGVGRDFNAK